MTKIIITYQKENPLRCSTPDSVYTHVAFPCKYQDGWIAHILFDRRIRGADQTTFFGSSPGGVIDAIKNYMKELPAFNDMVIEVKDI